MSRRLAGWMWRSVLSLSDERASSRASPVSMISCLAFCGVSAVHVFGVRFESVGSRPAGATEPRALRSKEHALFGLREEPSIARIRRDFDTRRLAHGRSCGYARGPGNPNPMAGMPRCGGRFDGTGDQWLGLGISPRSARRTRASLTVGSNWRPVKARISRIAPSGVIAMRCAPGRINAS